MTHFSTLFLVLISGSLGYALGCASELPTWRLVVSTLAGAMGGAGISVALQHIQSLLRKTQS